MTYFFHIVGATVLLMEKRTETFIDIFPQDLQMIGNAIILKISDNKTPSIMDKQTDISVMMIVYRPTTYGIRQKVKMPNTWVTNKATRFTFRTMFG